MKDSVLKGQITRLNKQLAKLQPGERLIKENLHNDVYHGCDGVSTSKLKLFIQCPAKYKALHITGEVVREEKKAFDVGSAAHCLVLEPEKFHAEFVRQPAEIKIRRGKKWDEFKEQNADRTVLTQADWHLCHAMRLSVEKHPFGRRLLSGGKAETSYFMREEETGLIVKCRTDYRLGDLVVDLKTAVSSNPEEFQRKAIALGYHIQDALYRHVTGLPEFAFVTVEKELPCVVTAPMLFDEDARRLGFLEFRAALNELASALEFDYFPGYTTGPVVMGLKPWDRKRLEQLEPADAAA